MAGVLESADALVQELDAVALMRPQHFAQVRVNYHRQLASAWRTRNRADNKFGSRRRKRAPLALDQRSLRMSAFGALGSWRPSTAIARAAPGLLAPLLLLLLLLLPPSKPRPVGFLDGE